MAHPSIAIVGAGIAGLTTALTLQDAGVNIRFLQGTKVYAGTNPLRW